MMRSDGKIALKAKGYVGLFIVRDSKNGDVALIVEPK